MAPLKETHLAKIYKKGHFGLSIEVFPPKSLAGQETLYHSLDRLAGYNPAFISCTFGAGGSTRTRTLDLSIEMQKKYGIPVTTHFTCVSATHKELLQWLSRAHQSGIRNIMALRGDPPKGDDKYKPLAEGLRYANELVSLIRENFPSLGIGVAAYPEKHPEATSLESDLQNLKRKVACGADAVFTQLFYNNELFFRFRERYVKAGIIAPLIPGIMPILDLDNLKKISVLCEAQIPKPLINRLESAKNDKSAQLKIGIEHAINQCRELMINEVSGLHFFVLNRSTACEEIFSALGFEPASTCFACKAK